MGIALPLPLTRSIVKRVGARCGPGEVILVAEDGRELSDCPDGLLVSLFGLGDFLDGTSGEPGESPSLIRVRALDDDSLDELAKAARVVRGLHEQDVGSSTPPGMVLCDRFLRGLRSTRRNPDWSEALRRFCEPEGDHQAGRKLTIVARGRAAELVWEDFQLRSEASWPIGTERLVVRRWEPQPERETAVPPRLASRLRVLVLLTGLEQPSLAPPASVQVEEIVRTIARLKAELKMHLDLKLAHTTGARLCETEALSTAGQVRELMSRDWDVVHVIGHSFHETESGEGRLGTSLGLELGFVTLDDLPKPVLYPWAKSCREQTERHAKARIDSPVVAEASLSEDFDNHPPRLFVAQCCATSAVDLHPLLEVCDHAVGYHAMADPERFSRVLEAFYKCLSMHGVSSAVSAARSELFTLAWQLHHTFVRRGGDLLIDVDGLDVRRHVESTIQAHGRIYGKLFEALNVYGRRALERQYVPLPVCREERADRWLDQNDAGNESLFDFVRRARGAEGPVTGRWSVVSPPGTGKTTLLRHLVLELANSAESALKRGEDDDRIVPFYVPLESWASEQVSLIEWILSHCPIGAAYFDDPSNDDRSILVLDGLDELSSASRDRLRAELSLEPGHESEHKEQRARRRWMAQVRIVLSSRPLGYDPILEATGHDFRRLRIVLPGDLPGKRGHQLKERIVLNYAVAKELMREGLSDAAPAELVARCKTRARTKTEQFLSSLQDPRLVDLSGTPLTLLAMAESFWLSRELGHPSAARSRVEVLRQLIEDHLRRCWHQVPHSERQVMTDLRRLRLIAWTMTRDAHRYANRWRLPQLARALDQPARKRLWQEAGGRAATSETTDALEKLLRRSGLFNQSSLGELTFALPSARDALVAEYLFHEIYERKLESDGPHDRG